MFITKFVHLKKNFFLRHLTHVTYFPYSVSKVVFIINNFQFKPEVDNIITRPSLISFNFYLEHFLVTALVHSFRDFREILINPLRS